jgi:hypothetical protein
MRARRLIIGSVAVLTSLGASGAVHAQDDASAPATTLDVQTSQVTEETTETRITVESEDGATGDDDDSDNTGLWGLLGLLGLVGLAGLAGHKRRETTITTGTPPVGGAAPRTAQGATGTRDLDS